MSSNDRPTDHIAADPEDLHGDAPESPDASTGLDRPFEAAGPVADPTQDASDEQDLGLEDRPMG
ncbi:MAG: hypothetical protein HKN41_12255 [Ilumatobacter sp.]|nr:hypothetical protein [Ilumatobacter sp.]